MKPLTTPATHCGPHPGARLVRLMPAAAALAILSACSVAPVQPPAPSVPLHAAFAQAGPAAASAQAFDGAWWAGYGDPTLTTLVEEALTANQDVAMALQRVAQARAGADAEGSRLWPTVSVQASASRSDSGLPPPVKQGMPDTRALRAGVDVAWEIDLAGGVRAARDAAQADAAAAAAGVDGARLLVASEVARQYFVLRGAEERLRIVQALAAAQRQTAARVESRFREGQASAFDLDRARAEADALDAQVPALRMLAGISQTRLAVLLGRNPSARVVENAGFAWPAAREIGTGQPSELLRRRPDLIAAEARVASEAFRSAEARAQWWPKLFLSAMVGRQDLRLNALDLAPVRFSNVALAFAAPIFDAGRIDAGIRVQSARAEEALLTWQRAVLVAVQEVEDSLLVGSQEVERAAALARTVDHRRRSLQRAESLQREGQIDLLVLLDVQRSVLSSELALSDGRLQQVLADVQLFKALGGGLAPAQVGADMTPLAARTPQ